MSKQQLFITNSQGEWINTWISLNYCRNWGIWEGIREILQNQLDGIIMSIGKINIKVIAYGDKYNNTKYQFDFIHKETKEPFGKIEYNEVNNILRIWNKGSLETGDLLLGGIKDTLNNEEIIGRFGEGMKLAALSFVREGKFISIITSGKCWSFTQKLDDKFIKNGQPQNCLHWKADDFSLEEYKDKVTVEITGITLDEWTEQIDKFLWLTQKNVGQIDAFDNNGNIIGQLLINKFFKNKIYVKDIFIQETEENNGATSCYFGYNTDLQLDRDRNAVKNLVERNKKFSHILGDIMNRRNSIEVLEKLTAEERIYFQKNYVKEIIFLLEHGFYTCYYINSFLTTESRNGIWNQKVEENPLERKGKNIIYDLGSFLSWIKEKKLPLSFYPYFLVGGWLWGVMTGSSYYKSYDKLYNELIASSKIVEQPQNLNNTINEIIEIIKKEKPNFGINNIKFKSFNFQNDDINSIGIVHFAQDVIYFSDQLANTNLDRIKKFLMLETCCHFFKINVINILINSSQFFAH